MNAENNTTLAAPRAPRRSLEQITYDRLQTKHLALSKTLERLGGELSELNARIRASTTERLRLQTLMAAYQNPDVNGRGKEVSLEKAVV